MTLSWTKPRRDAHRQRLPLQAQGQHRIRLYRVDGHRQRGYVKGDHGADQRRAVHLPGAGKERERRRHTLRRSVRVDVPRRAPGPVAAAPGDKLVSLTWDDPGNPSITRYEYQRKTGGSWGSTWTRMTGTGATTTQHVVKSLVNGTAHTYRIRAYSAGGGTASAEVTATPQPLPALPANASATAVDASSATLTWEWESVEGEHHHQVPGALSGRQRQLGGVGGRSQDAAELRRLIRPDQGHGLHL